MLYWMPAADGEARALVDPNALAAEPERPADSSELAATAAVEEEEAGAFGSLAIDPTRMHHVFEHNRDDILSLAGLLAVAGDAAAAQLVREGLAWAFVRYSKTFVGQEAVARPARVGIWRAKCAPAWSYRRARWSSEAAAAPASACSCFATPPAASATPDATSIPIQMPQGN